MVNQMPTAVLLNNIEHKDLRIITKAGAEYGDDAIIVSTFPAEFRHLQAHYPIVFRKAEQGLSFDAFALLGFVPGENLFLGPDGWSVNYLPLAIQRQPFLIGIAGEELTVHVFTDSPRISTNPNEGEAVYLTHGSPTPYMERMTSTLLAIHQGMQAMPGFVAALLEHALLEAFAVDVELQDGSQHRLDGFYTISEEKLKTLDGAALESLHRSGYLEPIYMVIASMANFRDMIERKNRLHAQRT
ncbi:hypothetical protein AAKU67_000877 [Oxalobacteraceae bacterium GrIS 2.11]